MELRAREVILVRSGFIGSDGVDSGQPTRMVFSSPKINDCYACGAILAFGREDVALVEVVVLHTSLMNGEQRMDCLESAELDM